MFLVTGGLGGSLILTGGFGSGSPAYSYFEKDLLAYLGTLGLTVYPGHIPQTASLPAISFMIVSGSTANRLAGSAGIAEDTVQITVSSIAYTDAGAISEQLRLALEGFLQKPMGATWIFSVLTGNRLTRYDPSVIASDKGTHSKMTDYAITHQQTIPTF